MKGTLAILKEPFPSQQTQLVYHPQSSTSSGSQIFMMQGSLPISVATLSKYYQTPQKKIMEKQANDMPSTCTPPSFGPLHIERPNKESILQPPPKGVHRKSSYNLNIRVAQNYSIVEDLTQAPSVMSSLEVIQTFPM